MCAAGLRLPGRHPSQCNIAGRPAASHSQQTSVAGRWLAVYITRLEDKDGNLVLPDLIHQFSSWGMLRINQFAANKLNGEL